MVGINTSLQSWIFSNIGWIIMIENFVILILLLFINLILIYRPIPILAFPVMIFTLYLYATQFITDATLPMQPYFVIFLMIISVAGLVVNALDSRVN